jgi:hypothetical protein
MKNTLLFALATLSFSAAALPPRADVALTSLMTENASFRELLVSKLASEDAAVMASNFEGIKIETVSPHTGKAGELCASLHPSRSAIAFKVTLSDKRYTDGEESTVKKDYYFVGGLEQKLCEVEDDQE